MGFPYINIPGTSGYAKLSLEVEVHVFFGVSLKKRPLPQKTFPPCGFIMARVSGVANPRAFLLAAVAAPTRFKPANQKGMHCMQLVH